MKHWNRSRNFQENLSFSIGYPQYREYVTTFTHTGYLIHTCISRLIEEENVEVIQTFHKTV